MPHKILTADVDPITLVAAPPDNETPEEKETRLIYEKAAKETSDAIDEELSRQRIALKKGPKPVKVLLLGQSESGKSTTLKNFQLMYQPKVFRTERASWRAIIQLNVVRSIHVILDVITRAQNRAQGPSSSTDKVPELDTELAMLKMRLSPLLQVEEILMRRLSPAGETEPTHFASLNNMPYSERSRNLIKEVAINSAMQWKEKFTRLVVNETESFDSEQLVDWDNPNDPGILLHACADDMKRLWTHPSVVDLLEKQNVRLEEMAGFFLDCLDEVTSLRYVPSDDHILRARLKTLGVSEHRFTINASVGLGREWRIFDVGGHRSQRAAWAPYFDDMDAIIFLCPICAFDQVLAEEPRINRLADSVNLWTMIVSNKLLQETNIILFLNKIDIMKAKLASGIKFADYINSYGKRPNDFDSTSNYLRKKFAGLMREKSPVHRPFYCHFTAVTDTTSTKLILTNIRDMLMRKYLQESSLMHTL